MDFDDLDDFDEDEFLAAWDQVDRQAGQILEEACRNTLADPPPIELLSAAAGALREGIATGRWPYDYFVAACGWERGIADADDVELWLEAASSTISPLHDPGTDSELQSAVWALEHADWLAIVVGSVRRGAGAEIDAESVTADLLSMPEIEGASDDPEGDLSVLELALTVLRPLWEGLGIVDDRRRLTELGRWGLPQALRVVWAGDDHLGEVDSLSEDEAMAALEILAESVLLSPDELRRNLARDGVFADEEKVRTSLVWRPEVFEYSDGTLGHLPTLAEGVVLTHRLSEEELELGVLDTTDDLGPFGLVALDGTQLVGDGEVWTFHRHDGVPMPGLSTSALGGPEGWLEGFAPGDLIVLRYVGGSIAIERTDHGDSAESGPDSGLVIGAAWAAAQLAEEHPDPMLPGADATEIVFQVRREHPRALTHPIPPLKDLFAQAGLEVDGGDVGLPGTPWFGEPPWLNDDQRSAYRRWSRALRSHRLAGALPPADHLQLMAEGLNGPVLDLAAIDIGAEPERQPLVELMSETVTGPLQAVAEYLLARAAEGRGDGRQMLHHLERALPADATLSDVCGDLADLRALEGDAREAHRLYGLAGLDAQAPEMLALSRFLAVPEGEVGRNHPCPCGSGKKYKLCHGRTARHRLADRATWLWFKIECAAQRGANREVLLDWAELASGDSRGSRTTVVRAMADPMTQDFALFEGGLLEGFLGAFGSLLPEDERSLVETWLGTTRRLLEVSGVIPMRGIRAVDLVAGESIEISDRRITTQVRAKDLLVGRLLPDGAGALVFQSDPILLPRMLRARLLELLRIGAAPEVVLACLTPQNSLPRLETTDGEELLFCKARYDVPAPDQTWGLLAERLASGGENLLLALADVPGRGEVVRGSFVREGGRITIETMAVERLRELQRLLLDVGPEARLMEESSRPMQDLLETSPDAGAPHDPVELTPELLEQVVRQHEDRWLGESIPALGGLTPRQAAADPDVRSELRALLDDFEWTDARQPHAATMNVDRLRKELGLHDK